MKKILDIIAKIINTLLILVLILIIVFGLILLIQNIFFKNSNKFLFELKPIIITSESMEPTLYAGDIIFIKNTKDYSKGDIITFNENGKGRVTHRIVEELDGNGTKLYKTKGDKNKENDFGTIYEYSILGEMQGKTSLIRNIFLIITNKFMIAFLVMFYIVYYIYLNKDKKKL